MPPCLPRSALLTLLLLVAAILPFGCSAQPPVPVSSYKIVAKYPHSTSSYTEGFFFLNGLFYEGTGLNGHSALLITQPQTGKVVHEIDLPSQYFGEGIIDFGPSLYQWTWQTHICFVYDRATLKRTGQFSYSGEGWGMTRTAKEIITSDGTATLRFRDPATFQQTRYIVVHEGPKAVTQLNELEFVKGEIYANVWHSDRIARIDPKDGRILGWIDLTGLLPAGQKIDAESVLNGIAYDAARDRLFVTGKQWPTIFEIKLIPR